MSLATMHNNRPHAATVFYVNRQFDLYFISNPGSRHGQDLAVNQRVCATINEDYRKWQDIKGLQLEGQGTPLGPLSEYPEIAAAFSGKFPDVSVFFKNPGTLAGAVTDKVTRVYFYRFHPVKISYIDNSLGFGHRQDFQPVYSGNNEESA